MMTLCYSPSLSSSSRCFVFQSLPVDHPPTHPPTYDQRGGDAHLIEIQGNRAARGPFVRCEPGGTEQRRRATEQRRRALEEGLGYAHEYRPGGHVRMVGRRRGRPHFRGTTISMRCDARPGNRKRRGPSRDSREVSIPPSSMPTWPVCTVEGRISTRRL